MQVDALKDDIKVGKSHAKVNVRDVKARRLLEVDRVMGYDVLVKNQALLQGDAFVYEGSDEHIWMQSYK